MILRCRYHRWSYSLNNCIMRHVGMPFIFKWFNNVVVVVAYLRFAIIFRDYLLLTKSQFVEIIPTEFWRKVKRWLLFPSLVIQRVTWWSNNALFIIGGNHLHQQLMVNIMSWWIEITAGKRGKKSNAATGLYHGYWWIIDGRISLSWLLLSPPGYRSTISTPEIFRFR